VQVFLGFTELSLGEITDLQVGDVIQLEAHVDQPLIVQVANQRLFRAQVGKSGNHLAAQIISTNREEAEAS
jgi:flagellar motor switch protein FliM